MATGEMGRDIESQTSPDGGAEKGQEPSSCKKKIGAAVGILLLCAAMAAAQNSDAIARMFRSIGKEVVKQGGPMVVEEVYCYYDTTGTYRCSQGDVP